ncbi:MAG: exodeoxyribonuclease VII small subunit [Mucinivorans sp.]
MTQKELSYTEAVAEIEKILQLMNSSELDVDKLGEYVARATSLLELCKAKLLKAQGQVEKQINV